MDKRILEKLNLIKEEQKEKHNEEARKKIEAEARQKAYIESKIPDARKWVEERLLDLIAEEIAKPKMLDSYGRPIQVNELNLHYCDARSIPVEAKAIAAAEIDGLTIRKEWVAASPNPNDETGTCWDDAHYEYYVTWTVQ